ncbi:MAG: OmpH family outer membrane protein [Candidatus Omnitrophica bacterium]|nr:OmpH family outer membrane protein [Candidatus Omnitrophota bacterium]
MNRRFQVAGIGVAVIAIFIGIMVFSERPVSGANEKFAFVDVAVVFDGYEKTKNYDKELRDKGKLREEERDALVLEIRKLKDEMALLTDAAAASKRDAMEQKVRELQDFDLETKKQLGSERNDVVREIFKDVDDIVKRYGERKGYDFIFNERVLLYRNSRFDITQDILTELNKEYAKRKK